MMHKFIGLDHAARDTAKFTACPACKRYLCKTGGAMAAICKCIEADDSALIAGERLIRDAQRFISTPGFAEFVRDSPACPLLDRVFIQS